MYKSKHIKLLLKNGQVRPTHRVPSVKEFTYRLKGDWLGNNGAAACPICQPEGRIDQRALSIGENDGKLLLHCFKSGCDFRDIVAVTGDVVHNSLSYPKRSAESEAKLQSDFERKAQQANRMWQDAQPIIGSIAEKYLREARGITCALPLSLRFEPKCWHGVTAKGHPAMIARIDGVEGFSVHRTYLQPDGSAKAGLKGGDKLMLGSARGGAVRLANGPGPLIVGEGIETTLSAYILYNDTNATAWASLSTSGMTTLQLPTRAARLIVAPDDDKAGRGAAFVLADRAVREGWSVSLLNPPLKGDFNDALRGEVTA